MRRCGSILNKFGRPSLLVDVIMNDIRRIQRLKEGDNNGLLKLIDIVEKGYANLSRVKMEKEMSNTITLSMIEEKLSGTVRREWSKEVNREDSKIDDRFNIFPDFLKFLSQQKRILVYEMADLRIEDREDNVEIYTMNVPRNRGSKCIFHNSNGHATEE